MPSYLRVRRVDERGVSLYAVGDRPVDVCIDGSRVWTFWVLRDTERVAGPLRLAEWPRPLRRHLNGRSRMEIRDSASGEVHYDEVVALGDSDGPIRVRDRRGVELGIDKSGKLVSTFGGRSERNIESLIEATGSAIEALRSAGVEPFLAYGTLLGAVREGTVLAHDSDADLGYVSTCTSPVDVVRESFRIQRELARQGWRTSRYSGAAFKIFVTEADVTRGLDVFGGFFDGDRLYLLGEIGAPFERDWMFPLGTCDLGGRPMPVPARPEKLLEATYGPGWRVPDPAFKFTTPQRTIQTLDGWFRGNQPNIRYWARRASSASAKPLRGPSALARQARRAAARLGVEEVLDVGAGRGADSLWLAQQGLSVTAYDYVPHALKRASTLAAEEHLDLTVCELNLTELRSVLAEGARLAHRPRPRVVLARHVIDATSSVGRESLARLCSMALREGGLLLAEFHPAGEHPRKDWMVGTPEVDRVTMLLRDAGASRIHVKQLPRRGRPTVRLVGEW